MTSKLIEELNKCETRKSHENVRYTLIDDELRAYIEESLECLEVLERDYDSKDLECIDLYKENGRLKKHNGRLTRKIQNLYKEHATLICDLSLLRSNNKALLKLVGEIEVLNDD